MAAVILVASSGAASAQAPVEAEVSGSDPEAVVSAAFFGTGPLAEGIIGVSLPEEIDQAEYDAMVEETLELLMETDEEAVTQISEDLTSGSPVKVDQALEDGFYLMVEVMGDDADLDADVSPQCGFAAVCGAVAAVALLSAVAVQNAAAVSTAAVYSQALWVQVGVGSAEDSLEYEQLVVELTEQLAV